VHKHEESAFVLFIELRSYAGDVERCSEKFIGFFSDDAINPVVVLTFVDIVKLSFYGPSEESDEVFGFFFDNDFGKSVF